MTVTIEELMLKRERMLGLQACRNLIGKYSYYNSAFRNKEIVELWSKRNDVCLVMPWGIYDGPEGIRACFLKDFGDRSDPDVFERIRGTMLMHETDSEVLEVAADGKTARGAWISPGHETEVRDGKPVPEWCWQKCAVDFIKEEEGWKIWHMVVYPVLRAAYDMAWTEYPQLDFGGKVFSISRPLPEKPWEYTPKAVYPADQPDPPLPYDTFNDIGFKYQR